MHATGFANLSIERYYPNHGILQKMIYTSHSAATEASFGVLPVTARKGTPMDGSNDFTIVFRVIFTVTFNDYFPSRFLILGESLFKYVNRFFVPRLLSGWRTLTQGAVRDIFV